MHRKGVLEAVSGLTNPFSSSFEGNELYFLSFGPPAKPCIDKDLIKADAIDRKAVAGRPLQPSSTHF